MSVVQYHRLLQKHNTNMKKNDDTTTNSQVANPNKDKKLLYEVSIIRPLVILLLVIMHSFTMYAGGWKMPEGIHDVTAYYWFVKFITGFRIETIALISGYVFAYQSLELHRKYPFWSFTYKKFLRLIIPGLIFSVIYYLCFMYNASNFGSIDWFLKLSSGFGHLWFLPMLFWCFLVIWTIDKYKLSSKFLFVALSLISIVNIPSLPFGMTRMFHFSFYCYLGYILYNHKKALIKYTDTRYISTLWITYIILVIILNYINATNIIYLIPNALKLAIACCGILALLLLVLKFTNKQTNNNFRLPQWVIESSKLCYGVYVFHQFILKYVYYNTNLPSIAGSYLLPWIGFTTTLLIAIILTKISLKTKFGRFLIG